MKRDTEQSDFPIDHRHDGKLVTAYRGGLLPGKEVREATEGFVSLVNRLDYKKAWLPAEFDRLRQEVAMIDKLDLLKELADKTEALASFERARRESASAANNLGRINLRLWRRMGEIYKSKASKGARSDLSGKPERLGATAAGAKIGHSKDQVSDAMALANVPEEDFAADQQSENPSPKSRLAERGRQARAKPKPTPSDPRSDESKMASKLLNILEAFEGARKPIRPGFAVKGMKPEEQKNCAADCEAAKAWLDKVIAACRERLMEEPI